MQRESATASVSRSQSRSSTRGALCPGTEPPLRPVWEGASGLSRVRRGSVLPSHRRVDTLNWLRYRPHGRAEVSTVHRVTACHCFLLVAAFYALSVSSEEKSLFGIVIILCEDIAARIEP